MYLREIDMQPANELGELVISAFKRVNLNSGSNETIGKDNEVLWLEGIMLERKCVVDEDDIEEQLGLSLRALALRHQRSMDNLDPAVYALLRNAGNVVHREQYLKQCISYDKWRCKER